MVALPIKSIQRGTISYNVSSTATGTATITAVNTAKTELRMLGFTTTDNGLNTQEYSKLIPRISLTNSTTVTANSDQTTAFATNVTVSFEVTEYY